MVEAGPDDTPASDEPRDGGPRTRPLFRLLQLAALTAVTGMLGLLVRRVATQGRGADLVAAVSEKKRPAAPTFSLPVLWDRHETWPDALLPALKDGEVSVAELRGHPVVINFWASWCVPCKEEAPLLTASARAHEVAFLGIDIQDFKGNARHFLRRFETNYVSVRDAGDATYGRYGLTGVPETYYLDARGRIVAHTAGQLSRGELEGGIREARGSE